MLSPNVVAVEDFASDLGCHPSEVVRLCRELYRRMSVPTRLHQDQGMKDRLSVDRKHWLVVESVAECWWHDREAAGEMLLV